MAKVFSELNVAYNINLDANASISFVKIDDKQYLKVEGKENSPIKVGFNRICEAAANFPGSEIRIPIRGQDDLVVKFDNAPGVSTVGVATATFNTSYDVGYGKGIYGPILFGTDTWNAWPTSDKNVDAYFFKGDKGRIFLRVNAKSKKPQKVLLKIRQVQSTQTLGKVRIPYTALNSVVPNTQSEANNNLFDFVYDASKNNDGDGFVRTLLFENIYYPKVGNKSGLHFASGNVYGPIEFYHVKKDKTGEVDDIRYTLLDDYNEAIKKKLGQNPTQWIIRKNGRELGVIESSASERDATNSIDEDFHLRIEDIRIVGDVVDATKTKKILWDNYVDITNDTDKLDIGDTSAYFNIINGSQELSITDRADDLSVADKDFSLVIGAIDDNLTAKLDVYHFGELEGNNNRPVVIGVHAGAWTTDKNKDEFLGFKSKFFRKRDCIFVNVEYRVSPQPPPNADGVFNGYDKNRVKFPAQIEDIAASVKWVRDNIAKYGGDPNNIILYGHGAGAHLSTLLITNKKWLNEIGVDPGIIKGCISSSNIAWNIKNELDKYSDSLVPNTKVSIYNAFGIDPVVGGAEAKVDFESSDKAKEAYDSYSPDLHLQPDFFPPILILSRGEGSTLQRADDFVKKLGSVGIASTSVFHYKYPGNKTYSQTSIAEVVGFTPDPPSGYLLPKDTVSVSQAITDFLTSRISFKFPDNAIIDYPIIDGQVYNAVSGISAVPSGASVTATDANNPSSNASQSGGGAKQIQLSGGGIFGAPGIDAIRIGYIDPTLGYVTGLSVCEANDYAQENRGTTFVAIDGDNSVNYLNINDVNKLTPDFATSKSECDGLKATVKCGEPILNIYGGGGVGAKANIIIGTDGSVMGVDLVHKGYGYQYPPLVQAVDKCYFGNGATFEAFLGEISTKKESFDKESDFEDYYVCPPGTNFGTLYDTEGKEIGKWDPSLYTNPSANPIAKQVADYQNLVNQLKNPWWTTRMKKPSKLTGTKDKSLTVFPVSHPCQVVEVKDLLQDSPKPSPEYQNVDFTVYGQVGKRTTRSRPSDVDLAALSFIFTSQDGTHSFEIKNVTNNMGTKNDLIKVRPNIKYNVVAKEISTKYKSVEQGLIKNGKKNKEGTGTSNKIFADYIGSGNDNDDIQITSNKGNFTSSNRKKIGGRSTFVLTYVLQDSSPKPPSDTAKSESKKQDPTWSDFMNKYAISPVSPSNVPGTDFAATPFTMEWDEIFPYDGDYIFRGLCDNVGTLYLDNEKVTNLQGFDQNPSRITKNVKGGLHTIRIDLENNPDAKETETTETTETTALSSAVDFIVKGESGKSGNILDSIFFTFTSEDGKDSFTFKAREKNQDANKESSLSSSVKAKFFKKGNDIYLDVTGSGTGKINFIMNVNDHSGITGVAAREVRIPAEGSNVSLNRGDYFTLFNRNAYLNAVQTVKASGSFKAGQTYGPIQIIGATSRAGKPKVTSNEIGLLDSAGSDKNIKITFETKGTVSKNDLQWERVESVNIRPNVVYKVQAHEDTKKYKGVEQGLFKTKKGDSQEVGQGTGNKIFADFLGSNNDNDDIQIIASDGEFRSFNKKKTKDGSRNTFDLTFILNKKENNLSKSSKTKIFDTLSYIDKADRKLWKTNSKAGKDANFIDKYGISPFDTNTKEAENKSYAGTHVIRWEKINFPDDGTYDVEVAVDDNVKIFIGNKNAGGKIGDNSGLKDEQIFDVKGFSSPGVSKGKQIFSRKFEAGDYRIRAELEQIDVGAIAKGNPMILAINITRKESGTKNIVSKQSWCENPLGASVTIEAPPVPVPQEPEIVFDRCPPTPMWTTRQPKAEKTWYPVKYNGYKSFIDQISKVPKKETTISADQNVEFLVFGEGSNSIKYLEFLFESIDGKESFVLKGVELETGKKSRQYRVDKKIKKNLKYKVTARISDTNKAKFKQVEQGLGILKGKSVEEASKSKKSGTVIFADFIGSSNDNDDIRVSISKGDGEFTVGKKTTIKGRTSFELFYELESKATIGSKKTVEIKPKFIKDKTDGNIYLDMTEYPEQEYELDFQFIMADTVKGGKGLAASKFEITGTNIQYNRYRNGKLVTDDRVKKSFKIKGGKKYGPVVFSGADKGASTQLISTDQIASLDKKSTNDLNGRTKKNVDVIDFNVILTDVSGVEFKEPQNIEGWSKFMNRYAISPVQPLYAPGTDGGGVNYDNSWDVEFPYDGFYKFEAQADNKATVYVDGTVVLQDVVNFRETAFSNKVFIPKGKHKVKVEVENQKTEVYDIIDEKIFSTKDNVFVSDDTKEVEFTVYGQVGKRTTRSRPSDVDLAALSFIFTSQDGSDSFEIKNVTNNMTTKKDLIKVRPNIKYNVVAKEISTKYKSVEQGLIKNGKKNKEGGIGDSNKIFADYIGSGNDNDDIQITSNKGNFTSSKRKKIGGRSNFDLEFTLNSTGSSNGSTSSGKGKYSGPDLDYNFINKSWSEFMNKYSVVPASKSAEGATYVLKWSDIEFPSDGQYEYKIQADNRAILKIDGKEVGKTTEFRGSPSTKYFQASKGKRTIEIVLTNTPGEKTFDSNPTGVALFISKKDSKLSSSGKSWLENPIGVSAVIIPPPCPKQVGGKGVIDKIIPTNPGTGYTSPNIPSTPALPPTVPVLMRLTEFVVKESGINYDCSGDPIIITPSNGSVLSYKCNPFGRITEVKVEDPGEPFTEYPTVDIISQTGTGVVLIPVFTPTIAPPGAPPDKIIQVTDLVGLKQTGWIDGRPYYGAVFSEGGLLYTGYYQTVGKLVRVYATLGESITGEIVTPPSAILRTGTDVTNNDPRLDIPGTPGGLVS